jgi:hypothetical protein
MLGLKYIGDREEGISVMLFKSYKSVRLSARQPYAFTHKDNTSIEAQRYYDKFRKLGIATTDNPEDLLVGKSRLVRVQKLEAENVTLEESIILKEEQGEDLEDDNLTNDEQSPVVEENQVNTESQLEDKGADDTPDNTNQVVNTESTTDSNLISEMSDGELCEYLEMNYNRDQLKDLIGRIGADISIGRKSESTLVSDLVHNHKDKLIAHITK